MAGIGIGVEFVTSNGGKIRIIEDASGLYKFGIENGWAVYDDFHIDTYNDLTFGFGNAYNIQATVEHLTGDPIMDFSLTSRKSNGKADLKITGLKPEAPYRLYFNGVMAKTSTGRAHVETNKDGLLRFNEVEIPDE